MKKIMLAALTAGLLVAAPAPAKNINVDISSTGFVPANISVQTGDTVTWTNKDQANHQVVCAQCPFTSNVLKPGETAQFKFTKTGKFQTVDPLNKNKKGNVTVSAAAANLTVSATPRAVTYGGAATVSGTLSTGQTGQKVDILAQTCGDNNAKVVTTVMTTTNGAFSYRVQPTQMTNYQARLNAKIVSSTTPVTVRPVVQLRRSGYGKFVVRVFAAQSFVGKAVAIQRYKSLTHRWLTVRTVFLGTRAAASTPLANTTTSSTTVKLRLKRGLRVRAVLPPSQAAPCYAAAKSQTVRA